MKQFISGHYQIHERGRPFEYSYFLPQPINHPLSLDDADLLTAHENAARLLGELNAYGTLIPDVDFFIQMHVTSEALASSRIEGTRTRMDEALMEEQDINPEKRDDWYEVRNYISAMNRAIEELTQLPVSLRLLKNTHATLLSGVRGEHKMPGEFRISQNWIGGASIKSAHFIPPHHDHLPEL